MACRIIYKNNERVGVENKNGNESQLFKDVSNHPMIDGFDEALSMYKNTETDKLYQVEGNYKVTNRVDGEVIDSYRDALRTGAKEIEIGFQSASGEFIPVKKVRPSFDRTDPKGFINHYIKSNVMADTKYFSNGVSYYRPNGYSQSAEGVNNLILEKDALVHLGWQKHQNTENGYTFNDQTPEKTDNRGANIMEKELKNILSEERSNIPKKESLGENDLKIRLLDFLNKIGVNGLSISDYLEKTKAKNGVEPSAKALADISNQIIAFKNGEITTDQLTEETAHFIVEGWNQEDINSVLGEVKDTQEWQKYSDEYRKIYSKEYSGQELEDIVKREVLGKVLSNSLQNNFSNSTSLVSKIRAFFRDFINFIRGRSNTQSEDKLKDFTEQVNNLFYDNQLENYIDTENFKDSRFVLYSTGSEKTEIKGVHAQVLQGLDFLRDNIRKYTKKESQSKSDLLTLNRKIKRLSEMSDKENITAQKQASVELAAIASSQTQGLLNKIKENKSGDNITFGSEENASYQALTKNINPLLSAIKSNILDNPETYNKKEWKKVINAIDSAQTDINSLEGQAKNVYKGQIDKMTERIMQKYNLGEDYRANVNYWLNNVKNDTSLFHRWFGQITNSQDALLGLMSELIERTWNGANREYLSEAKQFQNKLEELGVKPQDFEKFFDKGYLVDVYDHAKLYEDVQKIRAQVRKEITGENTSIEDIIKKSNNGELSQLDTQQSNEFEKEWHKRLRNIQENYFTEEYYKDKQKKYDTLFSEKLGASQDTINLIKTYSQERRSLTEKARRGDNVTDWTKLSFSEEEHLKALSRKRQRDKSFTDTSGNLKQGLAYTSLKENVPINSKFVERGGLYYYLDSSKSVEPEAEIALDLQKLDQKYIEEIQNEDRQNNVPQKFIDEARSIEKNQGKDAALRFIDLNSSVFFNEDFWDNLGQDGSYLDKAEEAAQKLDDPKKAFEVIENIRVDNAKRKDLLKSHKKLGAPHEIDATKMDINVKNTLKEIDQRIQNSYSSLSLYVDVEQSEESGNPIYKNEVNEAYLGEVAEEDMSYEEEINFVIKNSTSSSADRIARFKNNIRKYINGNKKTLSEFQAQFIEDLDYTPSPDALDQITRDYARTQVASYYKRLVPEEYTSILENRQTKTASEYLDGLLAADYIDIRPNYSFLDQEDNKYKNPNFDPEFEGGIQPKKGTYKSDKYQKMFAPDSNGNPTRNKDMFQALQLLKDFHRNSLKDVGLEGRHNLYKAPQMTQKGVDRVIQTVKKFSGKGAKGAFLEAFSNRVDDVAYGESIKGTDINVIPTYYFRDLKDSSELSQELFYTYMSTRQQAVLHKHRKNNVGEMLAIKDAIDSRENMASSEKTAKTTIATFKNAMDYGFYGVKEAKELKITVFGKKMDLTKFARTVLNFVKLRGIGSNPIVAATSWFTEEVQYQIEQRVKEITNVQSAHLGAKEYAKQVKNAASEIGKFQSKSKLNILGEYFGMYDLNERFNNSNYGYFARLSNHLFYGVHQMANFPVSPRVMFATLYDNKIVDGRIINFNKFRRKMEEQDPSIKQNEIKQKWSQEEDYFYNYIDTKSGEFRLTEGLKDKLSEDIENKDEYLDRRVEGITTTIKNAVMRLDMQIGESQQVAAKRHYLMNYLMTFRSWLSVNISNRTKNGHYNLSTGEYETGSYRSFLNLLNDSISDFFKEGNIKAFKDAYNGKGLVDESLRFVDDKLINLDTYKNLNPTLSEKEAEEAFDKEKKADDQGVTFAKLLRARRRSLRRVAVDTGFMMGIAAVAYTLMNFSDDDKDNYALQLSSYLMLRTLNETVSQQTALPSQFHEVLDSPFVGLSTLVDAVSLPYNVFDSEVIQSGRFKGETRREKAVKTLIPGIKSIDDMTRLKGVKDNYWFYNKSNIYMSPVAAMQATGLARD